MIDQCLKVEVMKIVIDEDIVGELSNDGEITTDDPCLTKLTNKIRRQKLTDLRHKRTKHGTYYYFITVKRGDPGYSSVVANILLDNGYGLEE